MKDAGRFQQKLVTLEAALNDESDKCAGNRHGKHAMVRVTRGKRFSSSKYSKIINKTKEPLNN